MKKLLLNMLTTLLISANITPLLAFSVGKDGSPYVENNIKWQNVYYSNDNTGYRATIPGSPSSGISGGTVYSFSQYNDVVYEIHCDINEYYNPPKKTKQFLKELKDIFEDEALVTLVDSNQKEIKYIAELQFRHENKVCRVYCSNNCLYWALVEGKDLSLALLFFDSIQITM